MDDTDVLSFLDKPDRLLKASRVNFAHEIVSRKQQRHSDRSPRVENGCASGTDWFRIPRDHRPPVDILIFEWPSASTPSTNLWILISNSKGLTRRDDPSDLVLVVSCCLSSSSSWSSRDRHEIVHPSTRLRGMLKDELYLANVETHFQGCDLYWRIVFNFAYRHLIWLVSNCVLHCDYSKKNF